jgi:hypothetical protein
VDEVVMAARKAKEQEEERFVRETLFKRFGAQLRKLPESQRTGEKAADFELLVGDARLAVIEIKRLIRTPRIPENGWDVVERDGVRTATRRTDNAPQRVAKLIQEAWRQLQLYQDPKILAFVNDETLADGGDLDEAFNGFMEYRNENGVGYTNVASRRLANGRIRNLKWNIDLYIWIDRARAAEPVFKVVTEEGHRLARLCFGCPDLGAPPNKALNPTVGRGRPPAG